MALTKTRERQISSQLETLQALARSIRGERRRYRRWTVEQQQAGNLHFEGQAEAETKGETEANELAVSVLDVGSGGARVFTPQSVEIPADLRGWLATENPQHRRGKRQVSSCWSRSHPWGTEIGLRFVCNPRP